MDGFPSSKGFERLLLCNHPSSELVLHCLAIGAGIYWQQDVRLSIASELLRHGTDLDVLFIM